MINIENRFIKRKESDNEERKKLKSEIKEAEKEKAKIFMDMGVLLYKKIREQSIEDSSFEKMCDELVILDKLIYANNKILENNEEKNHNLTCDCGNRINEESKFCSQCGKMVDIEECIKVIECLCCGSEIDVDSKYCVCCGSKLNNQIYIDEK